MSHCGQVVQHNVSSEYTLPHPTTPESQEIQWKQTFITYHTGQMSHTTTQISSSSSRHEIRTTYTEPQTETLCTPDTHQNMGIDLPKQEAEDMYRQYIQNCIPQTFDTKYQGHPITIKQKTPYLTVDVLIFYIHPQTRELSVYLGFKDLPDTPGWVLPGTYVSTTKGDINLEDALYRVLKNEVNLRKSDIGICNRICFFDDFGRDPRRSPSGPLYFVLSNKVPTCSTSLQQVGSISFRVLIDLVNRCPIRQYDRDEIGMGLIIGQDSDQSQHQLYQKYAQCRFPMIWQHDSMLKTAITSPNGKEFLADILRQCNRAGIMVSTNRTLAEDLLACPICLEKFTNPYMTVPCGHTFCKRCIEGSIEQSHSCPTCRTRLTHFVKNFVVAGLLDHYHAL
jgi:ADP-ribose pyrophosphatase YjhB (NUDIX family)